MVDDRGVSAPKGAWMMRLCGNDMILCNGYCKTCSRQSFIAGTTAEDYQPEKGDQNGD